MHEPRSAQPVTLKIASVNNYIECVDGEKKELAQTYAHNIQLLINYDLKRIWIDYEHCPF